MGMSELTVALRKTLADRNISGSEKRALSELLRDTKLDAHQQALLRHEAFELARAELADPKALEVIGWLEDVNKLLLSEKAPIKEAASTGVCFSPGNECVFRIVDLLTATERCVDICVFTIADNRISSAILGAHRRGIQVRVISDDHKARDLGSDIEEFRKAGIEVRLDESLDHMHHKFAVFDRKSVITGSFNWTRSASERNQENLVHINDARLVKAFLGEFDKLWAAF